MKNHFHFSVPLRQMINRRFKYGKSLAEPKPRFLFSKNISDLTMMPDIRDSKALEMTARFPEMIGCESSRGHAQGTVMLFR